MEYPLEQQVNNPGLQALRLQVKNHLSGQLEELLEANSMVEVEYRRAGTRLESRLLPTVRLGNPFVFAKREEGKTLETAVFIQMDGSGSMTNYGLWDSTQATAFALKDVLHQHGIACGIGAFSSDLYQGVELGEKWRGQHQPFYELPGSGTETIFAINGGAVRLQQCQEERKLLLIITDGEASSARETAELAHDVEANCGIQIVHIFLGSGGQIYEQHLQKAQLSQVARCLKPQDPKALARTVEEALSFAFKRYLKSQ
jgi:hypothetical protein